MDGFSMEKRLFVFRALEMPHFQNLACGRQEHPPNGSRSGILRKRVNYGENRLK